nr:hypothetical protein [Clostridia bacterium]
MMERLMTIKDVMEVIPLGKTSCVAIVNSLPHINMGGKLMIEPKYIRHWISSNTHSGARKKTPPPPVEKVKRPVKIEGLTPDGLIPYRRTKKTG